MRQNCMNSILIVGMLVTSFHNQWGFGVIWYHLSTRNESIFFFQKKIKHRNFLKKSIYVHQIYVRVYKSMVKTPFPHCQHSFSLWHLLPLLYRHLKSRLHCMWQRLSYQICAWLNVKPTSRTRLTRTSVSSCCTMILNTQWQMDNTQCSRWSVHAKGITRFISLPVQWNLENVPYRSSNWSRSQRHG